MKQKNHSVKTLENQTPLSLWHMTQITGGTDTPANPTADPDPVTEADPTAAGISNVLKTKHDTAKNSVGNIR